MKLYLAGPLFSEAERLWMGYLKQEINDLAARIGAAVEVMWPWEFCAEHELLALGDQAGAEIFRRCRLHLDSADMVIALLDGVQVDDGTAWEVGYFYCRRSGPEKPILGIRTDFRNAGDCKTSILNSMIEYSCDRIFRTRDQLLEHLKMAIK